MVRSKDPYDIPNSLRTLRGRDPYDIPESLRALFELAQTKRSILFELAQSNRARRRHLQVVLGIITALSGLAAAAVFTELLGGVFVKLLTAIGAFLSGCITLFINSYYNTSETDKMFAGASDFLALREKIDFAQGQSNTPEQRNSALKKFKDEYVKLSDTYDRYFPPGSWRSGPRERGYKGRISSNDA